MYLTPSHFNRFLNKMGQGTLWFPAIDCPCRNPHSGGAQPNCPVCRGTGQAWSEPVPGCVALTGQRIQRAWADFGQWEQGDLVVSLPSSSPLYAMGEFDRVRFVHSTEPFSLVQIRGQETAVNIPVHCINRAVVLRAGAMADIKTPTLYPDGSLDWPDGDGPILGESYTLAGRKHPEYYCYGEFPQDRAHHHGAPLPRRVVLRRFDLFGRTR